MIKKTKTSDINPEWLSTYGMLTAERILERFNIKLSRDELLATLKDSSDRYHHLVAMPLKNIFNGILITQVHDYQVYAQKILIDYKLSTDESAEQTEQESQLGTNAEEELKVKQKDLIHAGEVFEERKDTHRDLITESQAWLINEAPKQKDLAGSKELIAFGERVEEMLLIFQNLRTEFRTLIIDMTALLNLVPSYQINEEKLAEHQERLDFNENLSED
ncbi:MAG: hypothetical protein QNK11_04125 [Legionella sp.]|nr:hypothetical protein [Legionella sp.]